MEMACGQLGGLWRNAFFLIKIRQGLSKEEMQAGHPNGGGQGKGGEAEAGTLEEGFEFRIHKSAMGCVWLRRWGRGRRLRIGPILDSFGRLFSFPHWEHYGENN